MIVDAHGHYTQAPDQLRAFRGIQLRTRNNPQKGSVKVSDDEITQSLQKNLQQMRELGIDCLLFSPNAGWMGHDFGSELVSRYWTEVNNDLIASVARLYPDKFIPVCQLPQSPGVSPANCIPELERCVEMGFVGCNINPEVAAGEQPFTPSLGSEWWYPLWEKMVDLDVPGMIHASQTQNPGIHSLAANYIAVDTAAVVELCNSRVFDDFPTLKLIIPHGGGSVPYQWTRHRAIAATEGQRPFEEVVKNLWFDTVVFDQTAMELLITRIGADRVVFGTEMFGAGKSNDPITGKPFDNTIEYLKSIEWLTEDDKHKIFEGNAHKLFSRAKWPVGTNAN